MSFNPNLIQGQELSNQEIIEIFQCGNQGGMRRSNKTNSLVLISDPTKGQYENRWDNNIIHYTGMGLKGNQSLDFSQNKTLHESETNGVAVFLFEVFEKKKYVFQGRVKLAEKPYQDEQLDTDNQIRTVWIFPLTLIDNNNSLISEEQYLTKITIRQKQASEISDEKLRKRIETAPEKIGSRNVISKQYDRNQDVVEFTKRQANGICQLCGHSAPFKDKNGIPFLEVHHIQWLSNDGDDTIDNTVALCSNCHRKMHVLDLEKDRIYLEMLPIK